MYEDDDDEGCDLGEYDDDGEYEELLNEKLQQARALIDQKETVESRDLLNDVLNHGDYEQGEAAAAMIVELEAIIAAAREAEEEAALAGDEKAGDEGETA